MSQCPPPLITIIPSPCNKSLSPPPSSSRVIILITFALLSIYMCVYVVRLWCMGIGGLFSYTHSVSVCLLGGFELSFELAFLGFPCVGTQAPPFATDAATMPTSRVDCMHSSMKAKDKGQKVVSLQR